MPTPPQIEQALSKVRDQATFVNDLLVDALQWPIADRVDNVEEISYPWSKEELRAAEIDEKLVENRALQLANLYPSQPWGVFLLEFRHPDALLAERGLTGALRTVLRGLVPSKRRQSSLPAWKREHLLFICTHDYTRFRFAYFKDPAGGEGQPRLATFGWQAGSGAIRTVCEFNLSELGWPDDAANKERWVGQWASAFDVEKVTKKFYADYAREDKRLRQTVAPVMGESDIEAERVKMFVQTLLNRLMFLRFIERKGWLQAPGGQAGKDYLRLLFEAGSYRGKSFYTGRLRKLFFEGLAIEGKQESEALGKVPFLNGGLFEQKDLDEKVADIPNEAFAGLLSTDGLFYRYNFTVEESTPLNVEVAVDPEMLGKVFEELVTGRHESGSYYTPRPIVSFMCREALRGYLADAASLDEATVAALVDNHETSAIDTTAARKIATALDDLKAVDPACGSGAYLLGLLHEMVDLYRLIYNKDLLNESRRLHELKLRIISHNIYGVDNDRFATNIAMLRLWLSLSVDSDKPLPLPNLEFKIETGDSLTGPCDAASPHLDFHGLRIVADALVDQKDRYLRAHGEEKTELKRLVETLQGQVKERLRSLYVEGVIDWRVAFADVLGRKGGFDIVLANPPYVRQELIKDLKPKLKDEYKDWYSGTADLYVFFYLRALQLLNKGGMLAFISSNKWFRAGYGQKLRSLIARDASVRTILDFHDLPVFESAIAYPMIFIATKKPPSADHVPTLAEPPTLDPPYPDVTAVVAKFGQPLPTTALRNDGMWRLASSTIADRLNKMCSAGVTLREFIRNRVFRGITTGLNEAFVIDEATRAAMIQRNPASVDIIKPFIAGKDIKRWRARSSQRWLIVTEIGVDIGKYPAVMDHLRQFQSALIERDDQGDEWWELRPCTYYNAFDEPKIISTKVSIESTFTLDKQGAYLGNTSYFLPVRNDAAYLLGVLNSSSSNFYARSIFVEKQNGWYEVQPTALEQMPIPIASRADRSAIAALAQKCLDAGGVACEAWEKEIDERVAALYGIDLADIEKAGRAR